MLRGIAGAATSDLGVPGGTSAEPTEEGLVVSEVARGGSAASAGIRAGDLIREVNRRDVRSLDGYRSALRREEAEMDLFLLKRGESYVYVTVKPKT